LGFIPSADVITLPFVQWNDQKFLAGNFAHFDHIRSVVLRPQPQGGDIDSTMKLLFIFGRNHSSDAGGMKSSATPAICQRCFFKPFARGVKSKWTGDSQEGNLKRSFGIDCDGGLPGGNRSNVFLVKSIFFYGIELGRLPPIPAAFIQEFMEGGRVHRRVIERKTQEICLEESSFREMEFHNMV
jgi:hypothetical protein